MKSKAILLQLLEQSEQTNRLLERIAERLDAPIHPPFPLEKPSRKDQAYDSVISAGEGLKDAVELMRREPFAALKTWIDTVTLRDKRSYDREQELLGLLRKLKPKPDQT